jgi:hypothetical protein
MSNDVTPFSVSLGSFEAFVMPCRAWAYHRAMIEIGSIKHRIHADKWLLENPAESRAVIR